MADRAKGALVHVSAKALRDVSPELRGDLRQMFARAGLYFAEEERNMSTIKGPKFKVLTRSNWTEPDPVLRHFVALSRSTGMPEAMSGDRWADQFLSVELSEAVPLEVRELFWVARGVCLYGWFFYPLYHLGEEQLMRVADAGVSFKCTQLGGPGPETSF